MSPEERRLRDRIEELEEQVRQLEEVIIPRVMVPTSLSPGLYRLFCALSKGRGQVVRLDALRIAIAGFEPVTTNNLQVQILNLRRCIEPLGYKIISSKGFGYSLESPYRSTDPEVTLGLRSHSDEEVG